MPGTTESVERYEAEQRKLRQEYGSEESDEAVPEVQDIPEVNPEIYKDVEPLLFQGFLTASATIYKQRFIFKSLNHHEFNRLSLFEEVGRDPVALQHYYDLFLAYGVFMVAGQNVLSNREDHIQDLVKFFSELNQEAKQLVIRRLSDVNRRAARATILTEAFSIEPKSRMRWAQLKNLDLTSTAVTGFEGTTSLGLNWGQLTWRALNSFEDTREQAEREWENAKFIASAMAGKGMNKIYSRDKRRREEEKQEKIDRRERLIRYVLLNEPLEGPSRGPIQVARSVADLSTQLERDLKGEQDWHDKVITDHENRVQKNYESKVAHIRELQERHLEKFGDKAFITTTDIKYGLTPQEVKQHIERRREENARSLATKQKFLEFTDEKQAQLTNKWVRRSTSQGTSGVIPAQASSRPKSKPFNGGSS